MQEAEDRFANVFSWSLGHVVMAFKEQYPNHSGLNGQQMRGVLHGDLVIVPVKGTSKFELWKKEDILSGKLDERNAQIKAWNRKMRQMQAASREAAIKAFNDSARGIVDFDYLRKNLEKVING